MLLPLIYQIDHKNKSYNLMNSNSQIIFKKLNQQQFRNFQANHRDSYL